MDKAIAIIPARGGSKRLPGKNVKPLDGSPLIAHSIQYAKANPSLISEIYVSTDYRQIAETAIRHGAKVIPRPEALSGDHEPTVTVLGHVLDTIQTQATDVALLQPSNPLRPKKLFEEAFVCCHECGKDSLFTVGRNHDKLGEIEGDMVVQFNYEPGQRSQDLAPLYFEDGLSYISRSRRILDGMIMGSDAIPFVVEHPFGRVDIDTADDFAYAAFLLKIFTE
ncbi:acylneuraminate cytidylyltransferase family protein [Flavobacterium caeni]|uniref:N-acylneuraminate cytidylyltransferase n=1 Tax=Flavobacterium caeni TaxID=490189 RepID=A0A1G5FKZ2_9FLAO|nr:acylneuraminate cytidylyltransferase family protein [Flavobacterium caeni]SCY39873.1 N-acylneuraminate cytidylyltransferase [Flavobacterium caeni]